jgi:hypothetical protein
LAADLLGDGTSVSGCLRQAGFSAPFTPIEAAVKTYVTFCLDRPDRYR